MPKHVGRMLALVLALALGAGNAHGDRRIALVVGNAGYPEAPLRNPVNDAKQMAAKLKRLGFEVQYHENLAQKPLTRAITRFGETLAEGGGIALFFYAGHGIQVGGRNFLIPVDAQISSEASVHSESVDMNVVLEQLRGGEQGLSIIILDACRNNPFERRFRASGAGLAEIDAPKGTLIAYATAPGSVAADGEGANGLFTGELLKVIDQPGLQVEDVFKRVRANVAKHTGDRQLPWESSSLVGNFFFVPDGATVSISSSRASAEDRVWSSIRDSRNAQDFQTFLATYPDSVYAPFARNRLAGGSAPASGPARSGGLDYAAVPFLSERDRAELAANYPQRKPPKALAIAPNGHYLHYSVKTVERSEAESIRNALEGCETIARMPCILYAINDTPTGDPAPRPQKLRRSGPFRLDEVPFVSDASKARWLTKYRDGSGHRALALSPYGWWGFALARGSDDEARKAALETCRKNDPRRCFVYAVGDTLVWRAQAATRALTDAEP